MKAINGKSYDSWKKVNDNIRLPEYEPMMLPAARVIYNQYYGCYSWSLLGRTPSCALWNKGMLEYTGPLSHAIFIVLATWSKKLITFTVMTLWVEASAHPDSEVKLKQTAYSNAHNNWSNMWAVQDGTLLHINSEDSQMP